jgi:predicted DNA-binding ribbon-helix-helix protein
MESVEKKSKTTTVRVRRSTWSRIRKIARAQRLSMVVVLDDAFPRRKPGENVQEIEK